MTRVQTNSLEDWEGKELAEFLAKRPESREDRKLMVAVTSFAPLGSLASIGARARGTR